jgi:uncharacterized tellurite resistance protein B-like protein
LVQLQQRDPAINLQALEDRASVVFWRLATADRTGQIEPLRKAALPQFAQHYRAALASFDGARRYVGERGVGSVHVVAFTHDEAWDRAMVAVRWSGTWFTIAAGQAPRRTDQQALMRTLLVLWRKSGTLTDAGLSISSAHCPNCGAPETDSASDTCDFCGAILNDGSRNWALAQVLPLAASEAQQLLDSAAAQGSALPGDGAISAPAAARDGLFDGAPPDAGLLAWMIKMSLADGQVNQAEQQRLAHAAMRRNSPPQQLGTLLNTARNGTMDIAEPQNPAQVRQWLSVLAGQALADGQISPQEQTLLARLASRHGLSDYDLRLLLNDARQQAYQRARSHLRTARQRDR